MPQQERPFDLLNRVLGQQVLIRLKGGAQIRGKLTSFDIHMNLVIVDAEELDDGELKTKIGTMLLRGGNILYISPA
ncbi:MAG: RNA-binding protein [Candidatus Micrarchaeales archaeon]|nr:RNA-binding protein [Candidatus Micrarchaeales archaeon]